MLNKIKMFLSKFTNKPIEKGIGITVDDNIQLNLDVDIDQLENASSKNSPKYSIKPGLGKFEFIGIVKGTNNMVHYQLRHINSGDTFSVSKNIFSLFFKKCASAKAK